MMALVEILLIAGGLLVGWITLLTMGVVWLGSPGWAYRHMARTATLATDAALCVLIAAVLREIVRALA